MNKRSLFKMSLLVLLLGVVSTNLSVKAMQWDNITFDFDGSDDEGDTTSLNGVTLAFKGEDLIKRLFRIDLSEIKARSETTPDIPDAWDIIVVPAWREIKFCFDIFIL